MQCDEDVARALAAIGVDVLTSTQAGRKGSSDPEQLVFARQTDRVVYTTDPDFLRLARECLLRGETFPGFVYHPAGARSKREMIDALVLCDGVLEPAEMRDHVEYV
jgi:hypothetical protein